MVKPFIKIPGGKTYLLNSIIANLPVDMEFYLEPFLGGGSVFLSLLEHGRITSKKSFIGDANLDTMSTWFAIKQNPEAVILGLDILKKDHSRENYIKARECFNTVIKKELGNPLQAAYFIYLNKTCFNGLIRYNASGEFNTPPGDYKDPLIYDRENILECHKKLQKSMLIGADFDDSIDYTVKKIGITHNLPISLKKQLFVYLDPPYLPTSDTAKFTSYTSSGFSVSDQYRLRAKMDYLTDLGAKVMLSNSKSALTESIFKNYRFISVSNRRVIAASGSSRKNMQEYLIVNY